MKKLNSKGFSLHIVLPILALVAVGSIGAYMTFKSNAAIPPEGWTTIKSATGSWSIPKNGSIGFGTVITASGSSKYRFCVVVKASTSTSNRLVLKAIKGPTNTASTTTVTGTIGTSYKTVCSVGGKYPSGVHFPRVSGYTGSTGTFYFSKVYWQKYY